jgi:hypothetical protein
MLLKVQEGATVSCDWAIAEPPPRIKIARTLAMNVFEIMC